MNEAFTFIDKEFNKHNGFVEEDFVYPTTAKKISKELFGDKNTLCEHFNTCINESWGLRKPDLDFITEQVNKLKNAGLDQNEISSKICFFIKKDNYNSSLNKNEAAKFI